MSSGERPMGAAKGKQSDAEAVCQPPPTHTHPAAQHLLASPMPPPVVQVQQLSPEDYSFFLWLDYVAAHPEVQHVVVASPRTSFHQNPFKYLAEVCTARHPHDLTVEACRSTLEIGLGFFLGGNMGPKYQPHACAVIRQRWTVL